MSTETVKRCDVTGKIRDDVHSVRLHLVDVNAGEPDAVLIGEWKLDVCPDAIDRLKKFIVRGTTPPGGKGK